MSAYEKNIAQTLMVRSDVSNRNLIVDQTEIS